MYRVMSEINNFFERTAESGTYVIAHNRISAVRAPYTPGQYVRIMGSLLNDGVYHIKSAHQNCIEMEETLQSEAFCGTVVGLAVPAPFVQLVAKINEFNHEGVASESIPNYSVSFKESDGVSAYANQLGSYRKRFIGPYYFMNQVTVYD